MSTATVYRGNGKELNTRQLKWFVNRKGLRVAMVDQSYYGFYKGEQSSVAFDEELACYVYCADFINNGYESL